MSRQGAINTASLAGLAIGSLAIGASAEPIGASAFVTLCVAVCIPVFIVHYATGKK